jgi:hypothetical protein
VRWRVCTRDVPPRAGKRESQKVDGEMRNLALSGLRNAPTNRRGIEHMDDRNQRAAFEISL